MAELSLPIPDVLSWPTARIFVWIEFLPTHVN